jgi:UDP-3-O-[3-hydroxymyristoyl] N-acetylglucosamine deacetylase
VRQQTIKNEVQLAGVGVHTGKPCRVTLRPADEDSGRFFLGPTKERLAAHHQNLCGSAYQTVLGNTHFQVQTPEHLLAAAFILNIDNLAIHVDGPELPIMDGSAQPWLQVLLNAGVREQNKLARMANVVPATVEQNGGTFAIHPSENLVIEVTIDFPHPAIGRQTDTFQNSDLRFKLAPAQTFGFLKDLPKLRDLGLAKGATLENTLVYNENDLQNPQKRRFTNEPLHHKALDIIGDIALLNQRISATVKAHKPSHALTHAWLRKQFSCSET